MINKLFQSLMMAVHAMKGRFFHTVLSILGIIIGVAALVAILSLIDGMEQYAKDQIQQTTSLKSIILSSHPTKKVNGIVVKKDTFAYINYARFKKMERVITKPATAYLRSQQSAEAEFGEARKKIVTMVTGSGEQLKPGAQPSAGRLLNSADLEKQLKVAVVNRAFLTVLGDSTAQVVGKTLSLKGMDVHVIGVLQDKSASPEVFLPITLFSALELKAYPPTVAIEVNNLEDIDTTKAILKAWVGNEFGEHSADVEVVTNDFRLQQAQRGFKLFRVIMGMIVGISVLVGGIGVMNVLLISVTQRTTEIGVRKALGAKRQDIVFQFLAESIAISAVGCFLGLVLGIVGTMGAIPIIKAITKVPFQASYTANTIMVVAIVALLIGIIFGTYPALRASRLDPVEAIRRE